MSNTNIVDAAQRAVKLSKELNEKLTFTFNEIEVVVWPNDSWIAVKAQYKRKYEKRFGVKL